MLFDVRRGRCQGWCGSARTLCIPASCVRMELCGSRCVPQRDDFRRTGLSRPSCGPRWRETLGTCVAKDLPHRSGSAIIQCGSLAPVHHGMGGHELNKSVGPVMGVRSNCWNRLTGVALASGSSTVQEFMLHMERRARSCVTRVRDCRREDPTHMARMFVTPSRQKNSACPTLPDHAGQRARRRFQSCPVVLQPAADGEPASSL